MAKLSIIIPARNEEFLQKTIDDVFSKIEGDTEILVGLDGYLPDWIRPFDLNPICNSAIKYIHTENSIGQRAMTNKLVNQSTAEYIIKVDAHCSFSQGFDVIMMKEMNDNIILAPILMPLDPISWTINGKKRMSNFVIDDNFVMQHAPDNESGKTMCLQGSAWMITRENYWKWNLGDESMGSWGGQGVELGLKAFINGGECRVTKNAYYGHVFRNNEEDFPYSRGDNPGKQATDKLKKEFGDKLKDLLFTFKM